MGIFDDLTKRFDDLGQYSIHFPGDYSEQIALEMGRILDISIDTEIIKKTLWNRTRRYGEESICLFRNENDNRCFVLIECDPGDWIYTVVVRCEIKDCENVRTTLHSLYEKYGKEEGLPIRQIDEIKDSMFEEVNALLEIVRRHNLLNI